MNYAIITNHIVTNLILDHIVTNLILADAEFAAQIGAIEAPEGVQIGDLYDGTNFTSPEGVQIGDLYDGTNFTSPAPVVTVPASVTMRQARLALYSAGLLDTVAVAVAAGPKSVQIEWEFAATVDRNWPTLAALQSTLGLTEEQIDTLFISAATL